MHLSIALATQRRRWHRIAFWIATAAMTSGAGCGGAAAPASPPATVPTPSPAQSACTAASRAATPTLGVAAHPPFDAAMWSALTDLGAPWLRADLYWRDVEVAEGHPDWSAYESFIAQAQQRGVPVLLIINHPPDWARADTTRFAERAQAFSRAAGQWARGRVAAWEAFNEPNLPGYGWPFAQLSAAEDARLYADTVAAVNRGLRGAGDPAPLVAGALSPNGHEPAAFIDNVFSQLPPACVDAVSIHPYGGEGRLVQIRQAVGDQLQRLQGRRPPVWITEYGTDQPADQLRLLIDAVPASGGIDQPLFWFALRDLGMTERYGLIDGSGQPRPAYFEFKRAVQRQVR